MLTPSKITTLKLVAILAALTGTLMVALYLHLDYLAFLALGPGGTPSTVLGFAKLKLLSFFALRTPYEPHSKSHDCLYARGYLSNLPQREGERPTTRGIAPHRQVSQKASRELHEQLTSAIMSISTKDETKIVGISCIEKHGPALFHRSQSRGNEICHIHLSDGSMHMTLGDADLRLVLEAGWAERHPLSRGGWFERFVPAGFAMLYAPRDDTDLETVLRIVKAAA